MTVATGSTTNSDGRSCRDRHTKSVFPDCALADHLDHEARVCTVTAEDFDNVAIYVLVIYAYNEETVTTSWRDWYAVVETLRVRYSVRMVWQPNHGPVGGN